MTPAHDALVGRLRARLAGPLPGHAAHAEMAPFPAHLTPETLSVEGKDGRRAATLVLLYPDVTGATHLVLTLRQASLRAHSGQISLPGGALEPGETPEDAARREAFEEVGVDPALPDILGRLTPLYIPPSGFSVWPVVAALHARPDFQPQEAEVAALLEVPVASLLDPAARQRRLRTLTGTPVPEFEVPFFAVTPSGASGVLEVWGATAMMLAEFAAVAAAPAA